MRRLYIINNGVNAFAECEHKDDAFRMGSEMLLNSQALTGYLDIAILLDNKIEYEVYNGEVDYSIGDYVIPKKEYIKKGVIEVGSFPFNSVTELKKLLYINLE